MGKGLSKTFMKDRLLSQRLNLSLGYVLDCVGFKRLSDALFSENVTSLDDDYVIHRALGVMLRKGQIDKGLEIAENAWRNNKTPRLGRDLIHIYIRKKLYDQAFNVSISLKKSQPDNPWLSILPGDIMYFFVNNKDTALDLYLDALNIARRLLPNKDSLAIVLKRLTSIYREKGDSEKLRKTLEEFYSLGPTNFHDDEFIMLSKERLKDGNNESALAVLEEGLLACPKSGKIREFLRQLGHDPGPYIPKTPGIKASNTSHDQGGDLHQEDDDVQKTRSKTVEKIPVKTPIVLEGDDIVDIVEKTAAPIVRPDDVVTISSCVAGLAEGRMLMEGTVHCSFLSKLISRLVKGRNVGRFQATTPMANPLSVQALLEEVGSLRVILATLAGVISKPFGFRGWFYRIAGEQSALIDDIMGSIPPYDYYVIMGPLDSTELSRKIREKLGCRGASVVDANDLGVAWSVGYFGNLDPKKLEQDLSDNPAGNQDQRTPIVIVRES